MIARNVIKNTSNQTTSYGHYGLVIFATNRRVKGARTEIAGKATIQLLNQAVIHKLENPSPRPAVFKTATPETRHDIRIDSKKLKTNGAKRAGIISISCLFEGHKLIYLLL
tara:strand:- start:913 stop:1245 length:333 start_codon:yes stop_codon:yes gene_type:complete